MMNDSLDMMSLLQDVGVFGRNKSESISILQRHSWMLHGKRRYQFGLMPLSKQALSHPISPARQRAHVREMKNLNSAPTHFIRNIRDFMLIPRNITEIAILIRATIGPKIMQSEFRIAKSIDVLP